MLKLMIKLALVFSFLSMNACSKVDTGDEPQKIKMWVAPNETQEMFWKAAVDKWNQSGKGLQVEFTTIPATGSSEQAVLTALVSENAPDISTNIFSGFAAQLVNLDQLTDLSSLTGFEELIEHRKMDRVMQGWRQNDKYYVLPLYSNPTLVWWRKDILADLGIDKLPETFDDIYEVSKRYGNKNDRFGMQIIAGNDWADRWFDFISYYYATSNGQPYIEDNRVTYNNAAGKEVLDFVNTMFKNKWTSTDFDSEDPLVIGTAVGAVRGPWDIAYFSRMHPETLKNIAIGPMIRARKSDQKHYTFSDSKGLVIFNSSQVKEEAFDFVRWVLSDDTLNVLWLELTGLPPARGDLLDNPIFVDFYLHNPLAREYATYVDVAVPPAFIEHTIDVQKIMSVEMMEPIQHQLKNTQKALDDAQARTDKLLKWLK